VAPRFIIDIAIFVNSNWVDALAVVQYTFTYKQYTERKQNTQNVKYVTIRIYKHNNKKT